MEAKRVIVVGGGLAGMACAVALAGKGAAVTLVESRHALGGRASSFDGEDGELLDNCQHVLLGCCTNLLDLYRKMGVENKIGWHKTVHFMDGAGRRHDLWGVGWLPAPLHLGLSMPVFGALSVLERAAIVRGMLAMARMGEAGRERVEGMAFGEWLKKHGQGEGLIKKFYDPVLISALNEETRKASAKYAIQVFQDAMMAHRRGYMVGLPTCPLGELYETVPGVELKLNARVEEVLWEGTEALRHKGTEGIKAVGVRLRGGEEILGVVVLATNHHAVQRWVPAELKERDGRFGWLEKLESVPILGVHLWFDRAVMKESAVALIEGPLQWLFKKDGEGKVVHGVISAAREWVNVPKEEALKQFEAQVRGLFAGARDAKLLRGVIVIEKRATFVPLPGVDKWRPGQGPGEEGIRNLYLAGDWTRTGWPATMEGAVRSGYLAAEAVLGEKGIVVPDLRVEWPARLMGLGA